MKPDFVPSFFCSSSENASVKESLELVNVGQIITKIKRVQYFMQGSHYFTDKKYRTFPGPPREIFQDLFGAHECLNIKKKPSPLLLTPVVPPLPFPYK